LQALRRITENNIETIRVKFCGVNVIKPFVDVIFEIVASKISYLSDVTEVLIPVRT
jgi:hypothetical protein